MSTVTRLRSWLAAPVFPADEEQTRIAGLLNTVLLAIIAGLLLVYVSAALIAPEINARRWVIVGPICLLALVLLLVMRRGHVRLASAALSAGLWVLIAIATLISGGVRAPALGGYVVCVLIAGLLLSWRAALGFAAVSIIASATLLFATLADRLPPPYITHTPVSTWATQTVLLLLATVLLILARRGIDDAMRQTRAELIERRRAEAALRESEARFRAIFERAAIGIALVDTAAYPVESNPALQAMLGYSADELRAIPFTGFTHPQDVDADVQLFEELVAGKREFYQIPKRYIRKDGRVMWGNLRASLIRDAQGAAQYAIGMVADITERQQAEAALRHYTRRLEYLHDIDRIILTTPALEQLAEAVISHLQTLLPYNRAELLLVDWEAEEAVIVAQVSDRPTSVPSGYRYSLAERPPRPALLAGQIVVEDDIAIDALSPSLRRLWEEGMRARMLVPLLAQGRLIGTLHLAADRPYAPTEEERALARELADQLAIGLQHARLLAEVQDANARLQALSRQLVTAQEDERRRIARELHDEVGQALALVKLNVRAVQRAAGAAELAPRLEQSLRVIEDTLLRVRTLALDLRPSMLDDIGLLAALRWYVDQQASLAGLAAEVSATDTLGRLPTEIETVCFRVVQEALTNVVRHAQARAVRVSVDRHAVAIELRISDDGAGFDHGAALARAWRGQSGGLLGMRERVVLCGGRLSIESSAESGTTIRAWIPI